MTSAYASSSPQSPQHVYELGRQARDRGDNAGAEAFYKQALSLDCTNSQFHASLASSMTKRGALKEALPHWRTAQALDPQRPALAANLGTTLLELGQTREALDFFCKASNLAPDSDSYQASIKMAQQKLDASSPRPAAGPTPMRPAANDSANLQSKLRQNTERAKATPYYNDGLGKHVYSERVTRNIIREQTFSGGAGEARRVPTMFAFDLPKPSFPLIMERRGVSRQRFDEDMAYLYAADKKRFWSKAKHALTCAVSIAVLLCFKKDPDSVFEAKINARLAEMNAYYGQFGIRWSFDILPTENLLTYET